MGYYEEKLNEINNIILKNNKDIKINVPLLFKDIPLDIYAKLLWFDNDKYKNIFKILPFMVDEQSQLNWTGASGINLLLQSTAFIKSVVSFLFLNGKIDLKDYTLLDFGCGWGRIIRLFSKYFQQDNLFGVDPWHESIKICKEYSVIGKFELINDLCRKIPFNKKFDIINVFSVFTHLSEKSLKIALDTLKNHMHKDSIMVITIRDIDYWDEHFKYNIQNKDLIENMKLLKLAKHTHEKKGFSHLPHLYREKIEGEITFGDTSMSIEYIKKEFVGLKVIGTDINIIDPYQRIVFLSLDNI